MDGTQAQNPAGWLHRFAATGAIAAALIMPSALCAQDQSLASSANDPTASVMSFQLQDFYSYSLHNSDEKRNVTQVRASIPFTLGGINNITRLTVPFVTDSPSGDTGVGDMTVFDLAAFDQAWGRYGVGLVALLPTGADGVSAEKWALGPAIGVVARPSWGLLGLFNQNLWTVSGDSDMPDVNLSTLQPIWNYTLANGWSLGTSDMTFVYDWDAGEFTSIPVGLKLSKLTQPGGIPVQWQLSYERNFYDDSVGPRDTLGFTAKMLLPK